MIKKFCEFRDKLTLKQATVITIIIPLLFSALIASIFARFFFGIFGFVDFTTIMTFFMIFLLIFGVLNLLVAYIFKIGYKRECVHNEKAKSYVMANYNLSDKEYTKLNYRLYEALDGAQDTQLIIILWEKANCTFWAKLIDKDEVELIIKDSSNNVIYTGSICNFKYLKDYFMPLNKKENACE